MGGSFAGAKGVGIILSTSAAARVLGNFPFAMLSDKLGRIPVMVSGQLMVAAASIGTAVSHTLPGLLASRFLLGAGTSCSKAGMDPFLADITEKVTFVNLCNLVRNFEGECQCLERV